jgi:hypothetical protein
MKSTYRLKTFALVVLSICVSGFASADTIVYTDLGPGNSFNTSTALGFSGPQWIAVGFLGTGVNLSEVNIPLTLMQRCREDHRMNLVSVGPATAPFSFGSQHFLR